MAQGRNDKREFFNRIPMKDRLDYQIAEAKDMETLWKKHRISLQQKKSDLPR